MRVGAAAVDITPKAGTHLSGSVGEYRPARMVLDPLYARALVVEQGDRRACIVTLDVTIVSLEQTLAIRDHAASAHGIAPEAVMVHALQNHTAPGLGNFMLDDAFEGVDPVHEWLRGSDPAYNALAIARASDAIDRAVAGLTPVRMAAGRGIEGRLAFNRRAIRQDGTVAMPGRTWDAPLGPTWIRSLEGPIDPEVGLLCFQDDDLRMVAAIGHYACHPVHVFPKQIVSADWPGAYADGLSAELGSGCVGMVINGACGNINPWDPFDPQYPDDHRRMGSMLTATSLRVAQTLEFRDAAELQWTTRQLALPIREVDPGRLRDARALLDAHPTPRWTDDSRTRVDWDWFQAASTWSVHLCRERSPDLPYEVQAMRIGDVAIVGLPGEPFVEGQLRIKMGSPAAQTLVAHCTTQYVGYLPVRDAFPRGGHEVNTSYWSKLMPDALDMVVEGAAAALADLFAPAEGR